MNKESAVKINDLVEQMFALANEVLYIANNTCDEENRKRAHRALGMAIAEIDLEVLEPIYKQFPELRPPGMVEVNT